jgi:hypothetical protein
MVLITCCSILLSSAISVVVLCSFASYSSHNNWISLVGFGVKADVGRDVVVGVTAQFGLVITSLETGGGFC